MDGNICQVPGTRSWGETGLAMGESCARESATRKGMAVCLTFLCLSRRCGMEVS